MKQGLRRCAAVAAATTAVLAAGAASAQADTFNVACGDVATLRGSISAANATPAHDTIEIAGGANCNFIFTNSVVGNSPDQTALPVVLQPLTINGNGAVFFRQGTANMRFVTNYVTELTVNDVIFFGGRLVGTGAQGVFGGAIYNIAGTLNLDGAQFGANSVTGSTNSRGGAIFTLGGTVNVANGLFNQNVAATNGGAIASFSNVAANPPAPASVTVTDSQLLNNLSAIGGALSTDGGSLDVAGTTLNLNTATSTGGAIYSSTTDVDVTGESVLEGNAAAVGGGLYSVSGTADVDGSTVRGNTGTLAGGGIVTGNAGLTVTDSTVAGNHVTTVSQGGGNNGAGLYVNGGTYAISGSQITTNDATFAGGGLYAVGATGTVSETTISGNSADVSGGGAYIQNGSVDVDGGAVSQNDGGAAGGGIAALAATTGLQGVTVSGNVAGTGAALGGGLLFNGGTFTVDSSTLDGNTAAFFGGGFYSGNATGTITRSTISDNVATFSNGAGVVGGGHVTIATSTVAGNTSESFAIGGLAVIPSAPSGNVPGQAGRLDLTSSTVADNGFEGFENPGNQLSANGQNGNNAPLGAEIRVRDSIVSDADPTPIAAPCTVSNTGAIVDLGGNVEFPATTCGFDTAANPLLGELGDNGGPTATMLPAPGSPAIDLAGDCPSQDQRGKARPDGDACDAGSVETPAPETTADGPDQPTNAPVITFSSDEDDATFECRIDGQGPWTACASPYEPQVADGQHTIQVRAVDTAGYQDPSPASVTFTSDATAPETTITSGPTGTVYNPGATFAFTSNEAGSTFQCRLDGGAWTACTSPYGVNVAPGSHTFAVRAIDQLGNVDATPATRTWTYQKCTIKVGLLPGLVICV